MSCGAKPRLLRRAEVYLTQDRILEELEFALEGEGYVRGTPMFEKMLRERKVEKCREMKRLAVCSECPIYEECPIRLQHLRDL